MRRHGAALLSQRATARRTVYGTSYCTDRVPFCVLTLVKAQPYLGGVIVSTRGRVASPDHGGSRCLRTLIRVRADRHHFASKVLTVYGSKYAAKVAQTPETPSTSLTETMVVVNGISPN